MSDTLVLDVGFVPVSRVRWCRALRLVLNHKAEQVESYDDWRVRSVSVEVEVPSVIHLLNSIKPRKRQVAFSRHNVYARDKGICQYCGSGVKSEDFTYDHVIPRAKNGPTRWENIVVSCVPCNKYKGGRTPEEAGMVLRSKPTRPKYMPGSFSLTLTYSPGMPESWKKWILSKAYWDSELHQD